ncbi:MAG: zinc-ribbon domain-containing protein [Prevotellaceae bacterium]|jgi:DNA-directed RNA polymerase subunit RPC12/RpoP|nr:zinc-ribbon domain-containing protein [Prevotellaceae bacterium]
MALITCSECGKKISDQAASCPNCGNPINVKGEEYLCCPKCKSKEIHSQHAGFSGGKALTGALLTGGIGILAGTIGNKDVQITCLKCGHKFKAGDALIIGNDEFNRAIDAELSKIITENGKIQAVTFYKDKTNCDLLSAFKYVEGFITKNNLTLPAKKGGCAGVLLVLIASASTVIGSLLI